MDISKVYKEFITQHQVVLDGLLDDLKSITDPIEEMDCINMIENTIDTINLFKKHLAAHLKKEER